MLNWRNSRKFRIQLTMECLEILMRYISRNSIDCKSIASKDPENPMLCVHQSFSQGDWEAWEDQGMEGMEGMAVATMAVATMVVGTLVVDLDMDQVTFLQVIQEDL